MWAVFEVTPLAGLGPIKSIQFSYSMTLRTNGSRSSYISAVFLKDQVKGYKIKDTSNFYYNTYLRTLSFSPASGSFKAGGKVFLEVALVMKEGDLFVFDGMKLNLLCN